nr:uncharacterized protein LOC116157144 isoform X4 [Camelus dromedarius]
MNALRRMLMPGPEGCPKGLASLEVRTQAVRANHDTCPLCPQREDRAAGTAISSDPHDTSSRSLWLPVRRGGKRRPQRCLSVKDTESDITVTSFCKQAFLHCSTSLNLKLRSRGVGRGGHEGNAAGTLAGEDVVDHARPSPPRSICLVPRAVSLSHVRDPVSGWGGAGL